MKLEEAFLSAACQWMGLVRWRLLFPGVLIRGVGFRGVSSMVGGGGFVGRQALWSTAGNGL